MTATSPSMMGTQTQVTNENGSYRFPAVPPGTYELTFEPEPAVQSAIRKLQVFR